MNFRTIPVFVLAAGVATFALGASCDSIDNIGETRLKGDGTADYAEKENRYNIFVTLKGRFVDKADSFYLDGATELKVGGTGKIVSNYLEREGLFYEIVSLGD